MNPGTPTDAAARKLKSRARHITPIGSSRFVWRPASYITIRYAGHLGTLNHPKPRELTKRGRWEQYLDDTLRLRASGWLKLPGEHVILPTWRATPMGRVREATVRIGTGLVR